MEVIISFGPTLPRLKSLSYHVPAEISILRDVFSRWREGDGLSMLIFLHAACVCDNGQTLCFFVTMFRPVFPCKATTRRGALIGSTDRIHENNRELPFGIVYWTVVSLHSPNNIRWKCRQNRILEEIPNLGCCSRSDSRLTIWRTPPSL